MNLMEAGVIAGMPTGAIIGGVVGSTHGLPSLVLGVFAGLVAGALAGLLYADFVILKLSIVGVLWRAAQKRADTLPTEADHKLMTRIGIRGIIFGIFIASICWFNFGWLQALTALAAAGMATAIIAIARCSSAKPPTDVTEPHL